MSNTNQQLISNLKTAKVSKTSYGNHMYSNMWYVCNKHNICVTFSPRGGCSIAFQQFLDLNNLLQDGTKYNNWIQHYRVDIVDPNVMSIDIKDLTKLKYTFIKFIINPYIRAVSIYRAQTSHNLSFREYLKQLTNSKTDYFNSNDKYHYHPQYIDGEEKIITKYIKIDKNEKYQIKLLDGSLYTMDVNKYSSIHHGIKNNNNTKFCGDLPLNIANSNLPKSYKYFYDDEIKKMVEIFYKKDIEKYGYSFDDF